MAHQMASEMLGHREELSIEILLNDGYNGEALNNHQASRALPVCLHVLDHRKLIERLLACRQSLQLLGNVSPCWSNI